MQCFHVLIHGNVTPCVQRNSQNAFSGFYTSRWVVGNDEQAAVLRAFRSAERALQNWSDFRDGLVEVRMKAEEVSEGLWWRWLSGVGQGITFYSDP